MDDDRAALILEIQRLRGRQLWLETELDYALVALAAAQKRAELLEDEVTQLTRWAMDL